MIHAICIDFDHTDSPMAECLINRVSRGLSARLGYKEDLIDSTGGPSAYHPGFWGKSVTVKQTVLLRHCILL